MSANHLNEKSNEIKHGGEITINHSLSVQLESSGNIPLLYSFISPGGMLRINKKASIVGSELYLRCNIVQMVASGAGEEVKRLRSSDNPRLCNKQD